MCRQLFLKIGFKDEEGNKRWEKCVAFMAKGEMKFKVFWAEQRKKLKIKDRK